MKHITRAWGKALMTLSVLTLAACGGGGVPDQALSLRVSGIKTLQLQWPDAAGAVGYRVLFSAEGATSAELIATLPAHTTTHTVDAFLPAQVNGRYTVQVCRLPIDEPDDLPECRDGPTAVVDNAVLNAAIGYFKASNRGGSFGASVGLSADGHVLAVGVPGDDSASTGIGGDPGDTSASDSGAVYVFARGASGWMFQAYIKPDNTTAGDHFGQKVALSADGHRLAVAAPQRHGRDGAVYVYEDDGAGWAQVAELAPPAPGDATTLGQALALSADGTTIVVGEDSGFGLMPEVHVYTRGPAGWLPTPGTLPLADSDNLLSGTFAQALAVSGHGNTVAVASRSQNVDNTTTATPGAVYIFTRNGAVWSVQTRLTASNAGNGDDFGWSLALSADGDTLAVGARNEDSPSSGVNGPEGNGLLNSGAVYVFSRAGNDWSQQAYVKASNPGEFDNFGHAVALSADGNALAVTAMDEDSTDHGLGGSGAHNARSNSGAAYLYRRSAAGWRQSAFLKASQPDTFDRFGESVALSGDGHTLAVGSASEASASTGIGGDAGDNSNDGGGAVYLY